MAPSGPFEREDFDAGVAWLRERYEVRCDADIFARQGYLAGGDARRARELRDAIADPDAAAILCARGGYGATRLLAQLDPEEVARNPKWLIGFSDVTALHALWARAGIASWHASMVLALGRADDEERRAWVRALEGELPTLEGLESIGRGGEARGPLIGGNLAVLTALLGTPHAPPIDGAVLLLEDVGERPYRVDRMLTSLRLAGWFERVAAVVVGEFVQCHEGEEGVTVEDVLRERLGDLEVPVLLGVPSGHGERNVALPLGRVASVSESALRFP